MGKEKTTEEYLVQNIGGYIVKVGSMFATDYRMDNIFGLNSVSSLSSYLGDVKRVLHDKKDAKRAAEKINGKVYQLVFMPVEDDK